jgi:hypothetical protein
MEIEKAAKTIYFNLGATNADKAKAVAKGLFAAFSIYWIGQRTALPRVISLLTLPAVGLPLALQLLGKDEHVDQRLYLKRKIPLRAWLTGVTVGSFALNPLVLHIPFLALFIWTGARHRFTTPAPE